MSDLTIGLIVLLLILLPCLGGMGGGPRCRSRVGMREIGNRIKRKT